MSIKNVKIRFNLDKENDRRAYDYLQGAEKSYSKAVISAICGLIFAVSSRMVAITLSRKASSVAVRSDNSKNAQIAEMTALLYDFSAPCR